MRQLEIVYFQIRPVPLQKSFYETGTGVRYNNTLHLYQKQGTQHLFYSATTSPSASRAIASSSLVGIPQI